MPEILKNIKAEDRLKKIRIVSENDDVMGGQPEADGMKENDNNAIFDLACSVMHALAEVAKVDQKAIPQILDALGDSRTAGASQRIVNEVNKLAKAAQTAANQANDKANTANTAAAKAQAKADSAYNEASNKQDKLTFEGSGIAVMRVGAGGLLASGYSNRVKSISGDSCRFISVGENNIEGVPISWSSGIVTSYAGSNSFVTLVQDVNGQVWAGGMYEGKINPSRRIYDNQNTSTDKKGFLRVSGTEHSLTESDRTSVLGNSTVLVASQKLVNDVNARIVDIAIDQIFVFESTTAPPGFIARNGQTIDKSKMPRLFARYGSNMPDDRNRYHRMQGSLTSAIGTTQEDAIKDHSHELYIAGHTDGSAGMVSGGWSSNTAWRGGKTRMPDGASETRVKSRIVIFCNKIQ